MIIKKGHDSRDPWVFYHKGYYYHCFSSGGSLIVTKAKELSGIIDAEHVKVYTPEKNMPYSEEIWAPELHIIDGKCYIYVACDDGNNYNHRMYVLCNDCDDPQAPYTMHGKMTDSTDKWAIDATILHLNGKTYSVWSGWEGDNNVCQNIYIAEMSDPFTICSERTLISKPEYDWELHGSTGQENSPFINEGPCVIQKDGKVYIAFSASGSWCDDYCIGLLEYLGGDPLDASSWKKDPKVAFCRNDKVNGPGHCSVIMDAPDGKNYLFYHAFDTDCSTGWGGVHAVAHEFEWVDGKPVFGEPKE